MDLAKLIPQPFRNIYKNYTALDENTSVQKRTDRIQCITKDIFRLLLAIPFNILTWKILTNINCPSFIATLINIPLFLISPPAWFLGTSAVSAYASYCFLALTLKRPSLINVSLSVIGACAVYVCSENYENYSKKFEEPMTSLSNKIAKAFF